MQTFLGFALVFAGFISYLVFALVFDINQEYPVIHFVISLLGMVLMIRQLVREFKIWRLIVTVSGGLVTCLFLWWTLSFSAYSQDHQAKVGDSVASQLAGQQLHNASGEQVSIPALLKNQRGTLMVFYRGFW